MMSTSQFYRLTVLLLLGIILRHDQFVEGEPTCLLIKRLTTAEMSALRYHTHTSSNQLSKLLTRLWCEYANSRPAAGNYVNMTFPQKVVIYGFLTRGEYSESLGEPYDAYVKRFTLTHYDDKAITLPEFQVNTPNPVEFFFTSPITADNIRFTIIEAETTVHSKYCWHLDIFGCNATNTSPSPSESCSRNITCPAATTVQRYCSITSTVIVSSSPSAPLIGGGSSMVDVAVAIPLSLIAAALLLLFALLGAVMWRKRSTDKKKIIQKSTLLELPNNLYTTPSGGKLSSEDDELQPNLAYSRSSALFVSSQGPLLGSNTVYSPMTTEEPLCVLQTDTYEVVDQSSAAVNNANNPSYQQQHRLEKEYATSGQGVHTTSDGDNVHYEPISHSDDH